MTSFVVFEERTLAERAMDSYDMPEASPARLTWPAAAGRIRKARLDVHLNESEVARRLNMTIESYGDLEAYNFEAFLAIALVKLERLGEIFGVEPRVLLLGTDAARITETITFHDIGARLEARLTADGKTAEQFGDEIGWEVEPLISNLEAFGQYRVSGLYHITKALQLDWVAAVPRLRSTTGGLM